ncbi:hypothetical protein ISS39_04045 [Candidatus Bathyarchaeota archaeon]|nr:hypothetical protein [Candidatus Bathyarchaeota archaeon]
MDETISIKDTLDDVFSQCKSWLHNIDAEIMDEESPSYIKALHERRHAAGEFLSPRGKSLIGPKTDWSKYIEIQLSDRTDEIQIRVTINPSYKQEPWHDFSDRIKVWRKYVGDLARYLNIPLSKSELEYYYPNEYFQTLSRYYSEFYRFSWRFLGYISNGKTEFNDCRGWCGTHFLAFSDV